MNYDKRMVRLFFLALMILVWKAQAHADTGQSVAAQVPSTAAAPGGPSGSMAAAHAMHYEHASMNIGQRKRVRFSQQELAAGRLFLAGNAHKPGVELLPGGLQIKKMKSGSGKTPKMDDRVTIDYSGTLTNGKLIGRSVKDGKLGPSAYVVKDLLPGLRDALVKMKEGDRWQVFIPPELSFSRSSSALEQRVVIYDLALVSVDAAAAK